MTRKSPVCVVSHSFGNYRGEGRRTKHRIRGLDHFLLTELPPRRCRAPGWRVVRRRLMPAVAGLNRARRTSKHTKFGSLPREIRRGGYKWVLHVDASRLGKLRRVRKREILRAIRVPKKVEAVFCSHPKRTKLSSELREVRRLGIGGPGAAPWAKRVGKAFDKQPLPETCVFLRRVRASKASKASMSRIASLLEKRRLSRDQTVFAVVGKKLLHRGIWRVQRAGGLKTVHRRVSRGGKRRRRRA